MRTIFFFFVTSLLPSKDSKEKVCQVYQLIIKLHIMLINSYVVHQGTDLFCLFDFLLPLFHLYATGRFMIVRLSDILLSHILSKTLLVN